MSAVRQANEQGASVPQLTWSVAYGAGMKAFAFVFGLLNIDAGLRLFWRHDWATGTVASLIGLLFALASRTVCRDRLVEWSQWWHEEEND